MQFDFEGDPQAPASNTPEYTVSELSGRVKRVIEGEFSYVRVRGELGRVSQPASGHVYLDLKDDKAVISGVVWRGKASQLTVRPEQGLEVIVTGKLTTFPGQSKYQIVIDSLEPAGQGALMALLEERKKKLAKEGLMDESAKQELPFMPRVVGIVTSPTGAVIRDMMHGFKERFPVHVLVWPVRVQGEMAAKEIAAGIAGFNQISGEGALPRPDVLIVARGGGSLEDLWSFNEEIVARAAAASQIPLISAVGHETDWTLIDYVADARAPTPTKAAEWAVPKYSELVGKVADYRARQVKAIGRSLEAKRMGLMGAQRGLPRLVDLLGIPRQRLDGAAQRLGQGLRHFTRAQRHHLQRLDGRFQPGLLSHRFERWRDRLDGFGRTLPLSLRQRLLFRRERLHRLAGGVRASSVVAGVAQARRQLDGVAHRRDQAVTGRLRQARSRLNGVGQLLQSLSYQSVLARGFALLRDEAGEMVRARAGLDVGERLNVEFIDGQVATAITGFETTETKTGGRAAKAPKAVKKTAKKDNDGGAQGSLF